MYDVAELITQTYTTDKIGNSIPEESARVVYVEVRSITRREWYDANNAGLKPEAVLVLSTAADYEGESLVKWQGKRYSVMRTYQPPKSDSLELTLQEEVGDYE